MWAAIACTTQIKSECISKCISSKFTYVVGLKYAMARQTSREEECLNMSMDMSSAHQT